MRSSDGLAWERVATFGVLVETAAWTAVARYSQERDRHEWSGGPLVLMDKSAEDGATGNDISARRDQIEDRLAELRATVWSRLVVVADVLVEHLFEMSP